MKRVFRIQGEGKVKDIGLRGPAEYPAGDDLNARVAFALLFSSLMLRHIRNC